MGNNLINLDKLLIKWSLIWYQCIIYAKKIIKKTKSETIWSIVLL